MNRSSKVVQAGFVVFTWFFLTGYGMMANAVMLGYGTEDVMKWNDWNLYIPLTFVPIGLLAAVFTLALWAFPLWTLFGIKKSDGS